MLAGTRSSGRLLVILVLLGVLVGCAAPGQPQEASSPDDVVATSTPGPTATVAPTLAAPVLTPTSAPTTVVERAPSPSPAAAAEPVPSPSPAPPARTDLSPLVVRGTGRDGLVVRREPGGERVALADEGQTVTDLGEERLAEGRVWRRVRVPDGTEGWVAAAFLAAPEAGPSQAARPGSPGSGAPTQASATGGPTGYVARSPEYGMNVFLAGNAATTGRDLALLNRVEFEWQKSLFQWRSIEGAGKGVFDWRDADRVVAASRSAGVKIIARLDFQPSWARADRASNGPPDDYQDYADFVGAFVDRYRAGSARGTVHAIEIWNEPNLTREWGGAPIDEEQAADYVRLLQVSYEAAKRADPSVTVISAGLSPTCTDDETARPDDVYLQWMYDAGAGQYFDVLGAHGAGYDKPPDASPEESAARHNGCRVFTFRRVEDLRAVMERNGDGGKQVWLLEFGWTTDRQNPAYAWHAVTPETQGDYIVGAYRWAGEHWAPWIGVMALWNLPDPNWGRDREEYWWSVANPDGTARPALEELLAARRDGRLP